MQKKTTRRATKTRRNRKPWTFEVIVTEMPPDEVEGLLDCYARVLIQSARRAEQALTSQQLERVA